MKWHIHLLDDDPDFHEIVAIRLSGKGDYDLVLHLTSESLLKAIAGREPIDLVLLDLDLREGDLPGLEVQKRIRQERQKAEVVVLTNSSRDEDMSRAFIQGATDYIIKTEFSENRLKSVLRRIESKRKITLQKAIRLAGSPSTAKPPPIAESASMKEVLWRAERCRHIKAGVLILGPTGAGKEVVASHIAANRAPFCTWQAAVGQDTIIESKLFGHVKGAFSGATTNRAGIFVEANGGVLLINDIENLSMATQGKLLSVLEDCLVMPVGSDTGVDVDVQVIVTTNANLEEKMEKGMFRKDLYYRIAVVKLEVPPLAKRKEDIRPLVMRTLEGLCKKENMDRVPGVTERAWDTLVRYPWKGNVRELINCVTNAFVLRKGDEALDVADFFSPNERGESTASAATPTHATSTIGSCDLEGTLDEIIAIVEEQVIRARLKQFGGKVAMAARTLGKSNSAIYDKMKRLGIETPGKARG